MTAFTLAVAVASVETVDLADSLAAGVGELPSMDGWSVMVGLAEPTLETVRVAPGGVVSGAGERGTTVTVMGLGDEPVSVAVDDSGRWRAIAPDVAGDRVITLQASDSEFVRSDPVSATLSVVPEALTVGPVSVWGR